MKAYCQNCNKSQVSEWRPCQEPDGTKYEDLCCTQCYYIIASVEDRGSELEERYDCQSNGKNHDTGCASC